MANSTLLMALIESHLSGDSNRFKDVALQIAAVEAKLGHTVLSRSITDAIKHNQSAMIVPRQMQIGNSEMSELIIEGGSDFLLSDIVCPEDIKMKIVRIVKEYNKREFLYQNNLKNRNRVLLSGPSGTGKTMTASILARELHLPLFVVRLEKVITKYMGETSLKLSKVFDLISNIRGVYLFDEFDAIGARRGIDNEVGEMRRILNTFLQLMERDDSDSIIVAATNCADVLDPALFRRFDDVIEYAKPSNEERFQLVTRLLEGYSDSSFSISDAVADLSGYSHAEITAVCSDAIKESILSEVPLTNTVLKDSLRQKFSSLQKLG